MASREMILNNHEAGKIRIAFFLCCLVFGIMTTPLQAQKSSCENLGFELGDFTNWEGYNWVYSTAVPTATTKPAKVTLPTDRRQVIMSDTTAMDANTGNALRKIPKGYLYSARLGDAIFSGDPNPRDWEQSLRYTLTVDSTNALLIVKFALVLQYAAGHPADHEPRFKFTLYDQKGNVIPDCANYDVFASNGTVKGFQNLGTIRWRDWTTVGTNLLNYIGQTITIEFLAADCTERYHFGYAYFVAECHPLYITVKYCSGDSIASLKAPEGFEQYRWKNSRGVVVDTTQIYKVENPTEGAIYSCTMTSATGCTVVLQSAIARYELKTDFTSSMIDCKSNIVQLNNLSSTNRGRLEYAWDFGDGKTYTERDPRHTFATSGRHQVSLIVANPPSACVDTLTKIIESFSPPLVGISGNSTYCRGLGIYLKAYGAWDYTWSNGSKADSIEVKDPGGKIWLLGYSSNGCVSDTIYKTVNEDPKWELVDLSDTEFCKGGNAVLKVSGALKYHWSNDAITDSIIVDSPGSYTVTGKNLRGCEKTNIIQVTEHPIPDAEFKTSPFTLDNRHNQITCQTSLLDGAVYDWDMGDDMQESGATIQHRYNISNKITEYTISLKIKSECGCINSSSATVEVVPFFPNVFSPNGDGINDLFMPDLELQVMDRNGLLLYNGASGWDGTYKGKPMDPDTYFYLLKYRDRKQQEHTKKGYITLVR